MVVERPPSPGSPAELFEQYGCGPIRFEGTADALYERHLLFANVVNVTATTPRDRFEAAARSARDILSQRWVLTEQTYERQYLKRLYYLSMEFLIGRSLANNVTNLLLDGVVSEAIQHKNINWIAMLTGGYQSRLVQPSLALSKRGGNASSFGFNRLGSLQPLRAGCVYPLCEALLNGDFYMHLADLKSYLDADRRLMELYSRPDEWAKRAILNVAASGKFSSDRTIAEYARDIWTVKPCPVP